MKSKKTYSLEVVCRAMIFCFLRRKTMNNGSVTLTFNDSESQLKKAQSY
jgi:hypothetical protein